MSKKILALALFAIMVFSIVPFANAAAGDAVSAATFNVVRFEMENYTSPGTDPIIQKSGGDISATGTTVLSLTSKFSELNTTGRTYYDDDNVQYDLYAYIAFQKSTLSEINGDNDDTWEVINGLTRAQVDGLAADAGVNDAAKAILKILTDGINFDDLRVNNSPLTDNQKDNITIVQLQVGSTYYLCAKVPVSVFEFGKADASKKHEIKYTVKTDGNSLRPYTVETNYKNTDGAGKTTRDLYFNATRTGDKGVYNLYWQGNVLYIDYAQDAAFIDGGVVIPVNFTFFEDSGKTVRVPASGQFGYVTTDSSGNVFEHATAIYGTSTASNEYSVLYDLFDTSADGNNAKYNNANNNINKLNIAISDNFFGTTVRSGSTRLVARNGDPTTIGVVLPKQADRNTQKNGTLKFVIEGKDYQYESAAVDVVFRPLPRNIITTAILEQREYTVELGSSVTVKASSASATTFNNLALQEITSVTPLLLVKGMTITGQKIGTTTVQVLEDYTNRVLDQVTIHVVAAGGTTTEPAPSAAAWRVVVRTLNVRTGPGTNYGKVGTLSMNTVVTGEDMGNGWVQIGANQFVSKTFLTPVSVNASTIGNYTVTASSLNVRSGPGSSYAKIGSLPRNSVVEVVALQNGWAQLASGGWVSTLHIK